MTQPNQGYIDICTNLAAQVGFKDQPEDFLQYCITHSETEIAAFSYHQIGALQVMAGFHETGNEWIEAWNKEKDKSGLFRSVNMARLARAVLDNLTRARNGQELVPIPAA